MTVTLKIQKTVYGGQGLARLGDGRVCFVDGAFAGETVKAEIVEQRKRYVKAKLAEIIEPIPERRAPGLTVPGMVYAALDYAAELRFKKDQLENFLQKVCPAAPRPEVVAAPKPYNYRNKVTYHLEQRGAEWLIGYRAEPEHRVVDVSEDPLARVEINKALPEIRSDVKSLLTQGARAVRRDVRSADKLTVRWTPIDGVKWWLGAPPAELELVEQSAGMRFRVSGDGFFQVNPEVGELLIKDAVREYLAAADRAPHVLDLYCGVGVFGLACLKAADGRGAAPRLTGVESGRKAIDCARRNAAAASLKADFRCARTAAALRRLRAGAGHTVIVDPPRGGMESGVPAWLARSGADRIICISCDPATLARDLAVLARNYRAAAVKLFDMFPRTARFETLVVLERA